MIITNCPGWEHIYEFTGEYDANDLPVTTMDTPYYCRKLKQPCDKVDDCIIKSAIRNKTTEMFEVLE